VEASATHEIETYLNAAMDVRNHPVHIHVRDWSRDFPSHFVRQAREILEIERTCSLFERLTPVQMLSEFPSIRGSVEAIEKSSFFCFFRYSHFSSPSSLPLLSLFSLFSLLPLLSLWYMIIEFMLIK